MPQSHAEEQRRSRIQEWARADAVFTQILDLPVEEREAAVAGFCGDDAALARSVRRLLAAAQRSHPLLEAATVSIQSLAAAALAPVDETSVASIDPVRQIGPYALTERLGSGGMAVVWRGERNDGEFEQTVAVKMLRRWLDDESAVQRFREERRILAGLEHPGLARLLDGGVVDDGWPYFIMEYVDGTPITDYCDARRLNVDARLALLQQVLEVVQYAHQRLVVHRDLKPSNILVTPSGQIKLLDFGIARALEEGGLAPASELTQAGNRMLTPAYASPEQVRGVAVSVATDVYALGVLLYHLLAGRSPYRAPADQALRLADAVLHEDPPRASQRVLEAVDDTAPDAAEIAERRGTTPVRLARRLRGDLDAICQVAMRKEPERRYASVERLAADIERHRQRLPVSARAGNRRYRAGRFLRRHAVAVTLALTLPTLVITALAMHAERLGLERDRANAAAQRAEREAGKARQVSSYLVDLFRAADPAQSGGRDVTAVELVERGVEQSRALQEDPALQATMLHVLGQVNRALGRYTQAEAILQQARDRLASVSAAEPGLRADILSELGETRFQLGQFDDAERLHAAAEAVLPDGDPVRRARVLTNLGILAIVKSRYDRAESLLGEALSAHEQGAPGSPGHATTLNALGTLLSRQARHAEAIARLQQCVEMRVALFGEQHPATSIARGNLGIVLLEAGDPDAGEKQLQQALAVDEVVLGPEHPSLAVLLNQLASARRLLGDAEGAIAHLTRALDILRRHHDPRSQPVATALSGLGSAYLQAGDAQAAVRHLSEAVSVAEASLGPNSRELAIDLVALGSAQLASGALDAAALSLVRGLGIVEDLLGPEHEVAGNARRHLAHLHWQRGDREAALAEGSRSLAILSAVRGENQAEVTALRQWLQDIDTGRGSAATGVGTL